MRTNLRLTLIALSVSLALAACGGGGGGSSPDTSSGSGTQTNTPGPTPSGNTGGTSNGTDNTTTTGNTFPTTSASMTMSCFDTAAANTVAQCSGNTVAIAADKGNGVLVTNSGVQVYAKSTSDLQKPIAHPETATGFALATGGLAEVRLFKDASNFAVSKPALLLNNLGITWDGVNEIPQIIETFQTDQGRVKLVNNQIVPDQFHDHTDTAFYNFITLGAKATQANYANNRYFPRADPSRCPTGMTSCPTAETSGIKEVAPGDWRTGGTEPTMTSGTRLHEDGDVHAGDGVTGGTGPGVPFPGSKGYRDFFNMSYRYANMTKWVSQDTDEIAEWAGTANEHNVNRRGVVTFGEVTNPTTMPTTGKATYKGWVRGWYTAKADTDPTPFRAEATVEVDFATHKVTNLHFDGAKTDDAAGTALQKMELAVATGIDIGAPNTSVASYLTAGLAKGDLKGGIGGRFFGPATNGAAPPEVGASFSLSDAKTGEAAIGGFVAIKR
ncbi:MAG TPA: hypothetical protein VJ652_21385 [Noviherbaspirillum sp.]|nr:hypothetical protein [Noviherbaspirillum sp.]